MSRSTSNPENRAVMDGDDTDLAADDRIARLRELVGMLETSSVTELDYEDRDLKVSLRRAVEGAPAVLPVVGASTATSAGMVAAPPSEPVDVNAGLVEVHSPFVGTFYRAPSPDSSAFVEVGQRVSVGQTLCIVEAMKLMNEIEVETAGTIHSVLVNNQDPVQHGDLLFLIKAD